MRGGFEVNQRLGRPAQDAFKLLCSQAQLTCNPSREDDHGWDFMVEIPLPAATNVPSDKMPVPKPILVQVKSTEKKSPKIVMKVSNALKLAKSELPCFLILFQESHGVKRVYARHFWEDLIYAALKRGRQVSAAGKRPHKATMTITFSEVDDHSDDLVSWIVASVAKSPEEYGTAKRALVGKVGYEGRNYRAEVTFGPMKGIEDFVDHQLGLTDYLPVSRIRLVDSRFGIDAPEPMVESENARVKLTPNNEQACSVVLQGLNGDVISVAGAMRSPVIPGLPSDKFKVLVETWLLNWTMDGSGMMTVKPNDILDKKLPIERIVELARFVSWSGDPVSMRLTGQGVPDLMCGVRFESGQQKEILTEILGIAQTLRDVQLRSGSTQVTLAASDITSAFGKLSLVHGVLTAEDVEFGWPQEEVLRGDGFSGVVGYFDVEIGGTTFFTIFEAPVTADNTREGRVYLKLGKRLLRDCFVGEDADDVRSAGRVYYAAHEGGKSDDWLSLQDVGAKLWT